MAARASKAVLRPELNSMSRFPLILLAAILVVADPGSAFAQRPEAKPFSYPYDVQVFDLPTAANKVGYRLYVRMPLREPAAGEKSSSFYFLDPLTNFVPAAAMSYNYEYFNYIPSAFFIGIGYQDEADGHPREHNRTRDYTPTELTPPDETPYLAANPVDYMGSGGADDFLDVVESRIIPFVESRFNVDESDRVLVGKSMSGLAAVHAVLTRPGLFNRYVIVSPSIWWDDWLYARSGRYVMKQVDETASLTYPAETRVYFAVGDAEERLGLVTDLHVLVDALRKQRRTNLRLYLEVLDDEMHEGVFPAAFMRGIVGVYAQEPGRKRSASAVKWQ